MVVGSLTAWARCLCPPEPLTFCGWLHGATQCSGGLFGWLGWQALRHLWEVAAGLKKQGGSFQRVSGRSLASLTDFCRVGREMLLDSHYVRKRYCTRQCNYTSASIPPFTALWAGPRSSGSFRAVHTRNVALYDPIGRTYTS